MGETIGAEVPAQLKQRIDEYREPDESRSAAIERLIRDSLDDNDTVKDQIQFVTIFAGLLWIAAVIFAGSQAGSVVGGAYIGGILLWSSLPTVRGIFNI